MSGEPAALSCQDWGGASRCGPEKYGQRLLSGKNRREELTSVIEDDERLREVHFATSLLWFGV